MNAYMYIYIENECFTVEEISVGRKFNKLA